MNLTFAGLKLKYKDIIVLYFYKHLAWFYNIEEQLALNRLYSLK